MFFDPAVTGSFLLPALALLVTNGPANNVICPKTPRQTRGVPAAFLSPNRSLRPTRLHAAASEIDIDDRLVGRPVKQEKYVALLEWLSSKGATINDCLEIRPSSQGEQAGYGVFVTRPIEEGELLFSIPRNLCVTIDKATTSDDDGGALGDALKELIKKAGPGGITVAMAGFMAKQYILAACLEEDGDDSEASESPWGPYLDLLPWKRGINNQEHILFWKEEKIEGLLQGSLCYREAKILREEVALSIQVLGPMIKRSVRLARGEESTNPLERLSSLLPWQQYKQAGNDDSDFVDDKLLADAIKGSFVTLLTRSFQDDESDVEGDGSEKLVPLLDILQHSDTPNVRHNVVRGENSGNDETAVEVRARLSIVAGSELWNQYRSEEDEAMPYSRFFTRFGFVPGVDEPIENLLLDKSTIFYPQKAEI